MNPKLRRTGIVVLLCAAALVLVATCVELLVPAGPKPPALTRYVLEQCERAEPQVLSGIKAGTLPYRLSEAYASFLVRLQAAREGYIRVTGGANPQVLDGWGRPLHIVFRSDLVLDPKAAPMLRAKSNAVIVWSSGPNGTNEFGNSDDVFLKN